MFTSTEFYGVTLEEKSADMNRIELDLMATLKLAS